MRELTKEQIVSLLERVSCGEFHDGLDCAIVEGCSITYIQLSLQLDHCDSKDKAIHAIIHFLIEALRCARRETIREIEVNDLERLGKL
jgi:hypothetical protein